MPTVDLQSISQERKMVSNKRTVSYKDGKGKTPTIIAAGCGLIPENKRKETKLFT